VVPKPTVPIPICTAGSHDSNGVAPREYETLVCQSVTSIYAAAGPSNESTPATATAEDVDKCRIRPTTAAADIGSF
jgi:hypothetical protein